MALEDRSAARSRRLATLGVPEDRPADLIDLLINLDTLWRNIRLCADQLADHLQREDEERFRIPKSEEVRDV